MKRLFGRKFLPLYGILVILVVAFASPLPTLASGGLLSNVASLHSSVATHHDSNKESLVGRDSEGRIGNDGNNCGLKGDGTHDHGKTCPRYPNPGHYGR